MKIRITYLSEATLSDENFTNLAIGSEHEVIPKPDFVSESTRKAVWVNGVHFPAKIFEDEYEVINES